VPFGPLETPPGSIRWPDRSVMSTVGLSVLARHCEEHDLWDGLRLMVASLPALAGLKLIAYGDRRPAVLRDIRDLYHLARTHPWERGGEPTLDGDAQTALRDGVVDFGDLGAYTLGQEVAAAFDLAARRHMADLLAEADDPWSDLVEHVVRQQPGSADERDRQVVGASFRALRIGLTRLDA
jgi:predicted nucleotidyltransferase